MKTAIVWFLGFWVSNGHGGWQGGHFPDGSVFGTLGQTFVPAAGWSCSYQEGTRTDGSVYRYVWCANAKAGTGAELEVDACDERASPSHASRMVLLDFTVPRRDSQRDTGEVATINLGCSAQRQTKTPSTADASAP